MTKKRFRHYFVGTVHPRAKMVQEKVVDDIPQEDLDKMELKGVPVVVNHPPKPGPISDHPNLVRGEIIRTMRGKNGEKLAVGYIDHTDLKGCWLLTQIEDGCRKGLSLGHRFSHPKDERGRLLPKPVYTPDHVAIVQTPRREGCFVHAIKPPANCFKLTSSLHTSPVQNTPCKSDETVVYVNASAYTPPPRQPTPAPSRKRFLKSGMASQDKASEQPTTEGKSTQSPATANSEQDRTAMDTSGNNDEFKIQMPNGERIDLAAMDKAELLEHLAGAAGLTHEMESKLKEMEQKLQAYEKEKEEQRTKRYEQLERQVKNSVKALNRLRRQHEQRTNGNGDAGQSTPVSEEAENQEAEKVLKLMLPGGCRTDADVDRMAGINDVFTQYCEAAMIGEKNAAESERKYQEYLRASQLSHRPELQKFASNLSSTSAPKRKRMSEEFRSAPAPQHSQAPAAEQQPKNFNQQLLEQIYARTPKMTMESGDALRNKMFYIKEQTERRGNPQTSNGYPSWQKPL